MPEPAEDIPADGPMRQGELRFGQRAEGAVRARTLGTGAMGQLADQFDGSLKGMDAMEAVIADLQPSLAEVADLLFDGKNAWREDRVGRPAITHRTPSPSRTGSRRVNYAHMSPVALAF